MLAHGLERIFKGNGYRAGRTAGINENHGTIVNIELKNGSIQYPELEKRVIETVRHYNMSEQIVISSFNHYSLVECKHIDPEIRTGLLYGEGLYKPWEYAKLAKADALHAYHRAVLPEWVEEAKQHGVVYHPWTVNDEEQMKTLIDAGVAGIITDYPDVLGDCYKLRERDFVKKTWSLGFGFSALALPGRCTMRLCPIFSRITYPVSH